MEGYNCPIRYAGEYYDSETGEYYLRSRYYDSSTGRFTTEDTYDDPNNNNPYVYCANDPIQYVDPTGHVLMYNTNSRKVENVPTGVVSYALSSGYQSLASRTNVVGVTNAAASVPQSLFTSSQSSRGSSSGGGSSSSGGGAGSSASSGSAGSSQVPTTPDPSKVNDNKTPTPQKNAIPEQPKPPAENKQPSDAQKQQDPNQQIKSALGASGVPGNDGYYINNKFYSYVDMYGMLDKLGIPEQYRVQIIKMLKERPKIIAPDAGVVAPYNANVELLQRLLGGFWMNTGGIDGRWGDKTRASIVAIDNNMGTGYEGGLNDQTWVQGIVGFLVKYSAADENGQHALREDLDYNWNNEYIRLQTGHRLEEIFSGLSQIEQERIKKLIASIKASSEGTVDAPTAQETGNPKPNPNVSDLSYVSIDVSKYSTDVQNSINECLKGIQQYKNDEIMLDFYLSALDNVIDYANGWGNKIEVVKDRGRAVLTGGLQTIGGATEAITGAAIFSGASWTGIGIAVGVGGGYIAIDGASNVVGGLSKIGSAIGGKNEGDFANFMKIGYKKISPQYGENIYNLTQLGIGVFTVAKGLTELPEDAVKFVPRPKNIARAQTEGLATNTVVLNVGNQVVVTTKTQSGMILQKTIIDKTAMTSGALLIGVDVYNAKGSGESIK